MLRAESAENTRAAIPGAPAMTVAGALPAVAGDFVCASGTARGQDDGAGAEHLEAPAIALVSDDAGGAAPAGQEADHRELHVAERALPPVDPAAPVERVIDRVVVDLGGDAEEEIPVETFRNGVISLHDVDL